MPKRKKSMYRDVKILWESDVVHPTLKRTNKLKIVDRHPYSPTLWIDRRDGRKAIIMTLEELLEIKRLIAAGEKALIELTEHYEATKPPILKHSFYAKCLLCFSDLPKTDFSYNESYSCSTCFRNLVENQTLNNKWHAICHPCGTKAELVAKLQSDVLFRAEFNRLRNKIIRSQAAPLQ